ncbi:hypothetical protein EUTSA_v10009866mg [Eutrema salsugineum]|uniref:Isopropylmalate dehydrogenase-like domain-containing protein n=1 Tax=Eutrema salsugineum TaxID=72664 RepID=V4K7H9_EUTSA|nr:hypothetical protein EUTSA_v10009866mg [Eutrema salsugineum]
MSHKSISLLKNLSRTTSTRRTVTVINSNVTNSVHQVMDAMHAPVYFETYDIKGNMNHLPQEVVRSIRKNKVCLNGRLETSLCGGARKELGLFAFMVNCFNLNGQRSRQKNVNIVVIRENTDAEYAWREHEIAKICCLQLVEKLERFDVIVTPSLYGNLIANIAAGPAGGNGDNIMPGGSFGGEYAVFEQVGCVRNNENPVALLFSSAMMLRYLQLPLSADRLETALKRFISEGKCGNSNTTAQEVVDAVIANLD